MTKKQEGIKTQGVSDMAKCDVSVNFKCDEDLKTFLAKVSFDTDKTISEIIRCSLHLSLHTIKANPVLINSIANSEGSQ